MHACMKYFMIEVCLHELAVFVEQLGECIKVWCYNSVHLSSYHNTTGSQILSCRVLYNMLCINTGVCQSPW